MNTSAESDDDGAAPAIGGRREAREQALLLLYELAIRGVSGQALIDEAQVPYDAYTDDVVIGVSADVDDLDATIAAYLRDWPLERLATIDRAVLRMGVWELRHRPDIPQAVVLNEAVELAKRYGTDESGGFVNGVLVAVRNATTGTGTGS